MRGYKLNFLVIILLFVLIFMFNLSYNSDVIKLEQESNKSISKIIKDLESPKFEGRFLGTEGAENSREYLLETLGGLNGSINVQTFDAMTIEYDKTASLGINTDETVLNYEIDKDFNINYNNYTGNIDYTGDFVFLEKGFYNTDIEDVKGKVVVFKSNYISQDLIDEMLEKQIRGVLINKDNFIFNNMGKKPDLGVKKSEKLFIATISNKVYATLKENMAYEVGTGKYIEKKDRMRAISGIIPGGYVKVQDNYPISEGMNFFYEVRGKDHSKKTVIVGAYDGLGMYDGKVLNCTVENLTSTAVILDTAMKLDAYEIVPEHDLIFAFLDGSQLGDVGMYHMMNSPVFDLSESEFICIDRIGSTDKLYVAIENREGVFNSNNRILYFKLQMLFGSAHTRLNYLPIKNDEVAVPLIMKGYPTAYIKSSEDEAYNPYINTYEDNSDKINYDTLDALSRGLLSYIKRDVYKDNSNDFMSKGIFISINIILIILILYYIFYTTYRIKPDIKIMGITIEELYISRGTVLLRKSISIVLPTILTIIGIVSILVIPSYITQTPYNGGYSNYIPYIHVRDVYYYLLSLFSGRLISGSSTVKDALYMGMKNSLLILIVSLIIAMVLGVIIGISSAKRESKVSSILGLTIFSIPDVLMSLIGLLAVAYIGKHFGSDLIETSVLRSKVVPIIVMVIIPCIYTTQLVKISYNDEKSRPYVFGARSRGVKDSKILTKYILPRILTRLFDSSGLIIKISLLNLILVEYLYSTGGIGSYLITNFYDPAYLLFISIALGVLYFALSWMLRLISSIIKPSGGM